MWTTVGFDCESGTFYMHIAPARHILITDFSERWCPIGKYIYAICCCLLRFFCTGRGCFLHHASIGYAEYGVHLFKANAVSLPEDLDWSAPIVSVRCFFFSRCDVKLFRFVRPTIWLFWEIECPMERTIWWIFYRSKALFQPILRIINST